MTRGLEETAQLWPPIRLAYSWVHRAAHILADEGYRHLEEARRDYRHLLSEMSRRKEEVGDLSGVVSLFLKVTKSYWKGLFGCHRFPDLPRTNNDLEQFFGSSRHHERRATGRKSASPALVLRGSVRLVAAAATRLRSRSGAELQPRDPTAWKCLRRQLGARQHIRRCGLRFRRDPQAYLSQLQADLLRLTLPS